MNSIKIRLNVDYIIEQAASSGVVGAPLDRLRARLEKHNEARNPAFNLAMGKAARAIEMLGRDWILSDFIAPDITPPAQLLPVATEILTRVMGGQWDIVGQEFEKLADKNERAGCGSQLSAVETRLWKKQSDDLREVASQLIARGRSGRGTFVRSRLANSAYQAHRAACVLACPLDDCALRNCTETRCNGKEN